MEAYYKIKLAGLQIYVLLGIWEVRLKLLFFITDFIVHFQKTDVVKVKI